MKHVFKRILPLLLIVLLIIGCIPFVSFGEEPSGLTLDSSVTIDFYAEGNSEVILDFTPAADGFYVFYTEGDEDTLGTVCLNGTYVAENDDFHNTNFRVLCRLEKEKTYQLSVALWNSEPVYDGIVTVKAAKLVPSDLAVGESISRSIAPGGMELIRLNAEADSSYLVSVDTEDLCFGIYCELLSDSELDFHKGDDLGASSPVYLYNDPDWAYYVLAMSGNTEETLSFTLESTKAVAATGIVLDRASYEGIVGTSLYLNATFLPANAAIEPIEWVSSNEEVAVVDSNGKVTFLKAGTATITAKTETLSASCAVTVKAPSSIGVCTPVTVSLTPGESTAFLFTVTKEDLYCFNSFDLEGLLADPFASIYNAETGKPLYSGDDSNNTRHFRITARLKAGSYLFVISSYTNIIGSYEDVRTFNVRVSSSHQGIPTHFANGNYTASGKNGHSGVCEYCGAFTEPHTYDDDWNCLLCGYEHGENHVINDPDGYDHLYHYGECAECGWWAALPHTFEGEDQKCICGYAFHAHDIPALAYYNDSVHEGVCTVCDYLIETPHEYDEDGNCVCGYFKHTHLFNDYNITESEHDCVCELCYIGFCESHDFDETGKCICGYFDHEHESNGKYTDYFDEYAHQTTCSSCGLIFWEYHGFDAEGNCACGYFEHEHELEDYKELDDYQHFCVCTICDLEFVERHHFDENDCCPTCGMGYGTLGDVNDDGALTISDVTALLDVIAGQAEAPGMSIADMSGDDTLTISDVTLLLDILAGTVTI